MRLHPPNQLGLPRRVFSQRLKDRVGGPGLSGFPEDRIRVPPVPEAQFRKPVIRELNLPSDSSPTKSPDESSKVIISKRKIPSERSQAKSLKQKFPSESSQAKTSSASFRVKVPQRKIPSRMSQAKDATPKLSSGSSQAKITKLKFPS